MLRLAIVGKHFVAVRGLFWSSIVLTTTWLAWHEPSAPDLALPVRVKLHSDIVYKRTKSQILRLDVYLAEDEYTQTTHSEAGKPQRTAFVVFHGGNWIGGTKAEEGRWYLPLVREGCVVFSADYTLSTSAHPSWPECASDAREAVRWVRKHSLEYGVDPNRIVAAGSSSGGTLALLLGRNEVVAGEGDQSSQAASARVQAVVAFYPEVEKNNQTGFRAIRLESSGKSVPRPVFSGRRRPCRLA